MTTRVLIFGISGMLGSAAFQLFSQDESLDVFGTARSGSVKNYFPTRSHEKIIAGIDVLDIDCLARVMHRVQPDVVINCIGLIKQHEIANDPLIVLPINSIFPHRLSAICRLSGARFVQVSTDCVFDGRTGGYIESDQANAIDLYGQSKFIGEVRDQSHAITLRTSIIGHELNSKHALVEWFLSQRNSIAGFQQAIFSGLPTVELARVIKDFIIPQPNLFGLYHVSAIPISKFDLLSLVSSVYDKEVAIIPDSKVVINRSLNSELFRKETGYIAPEWQELVKLMKNTKI
jgi:dTDP-4-dehydrorhamnose reductase